MAKRKLTNAAAPAELTMRLHAPGMTPLHRAGLGGLAATLRYIARARDTGELSAEQVPGHPWPAETLPWQIDRDSVTLRFGAAEGAAADFFTKLFAVSFTIRDGLVYTPGQYGELPPPRPVRAALQDGLLRTFYDHGPKSRGLGDRLQITYEVDGQQIVLEYPRMVWYIHQRDGASLAAASLGKAQPLTRMLYPGAIKRHAAHAESSITNPAPLFVPLLFAPVGCFALRAGGRRVKDNNRRVFKSGGAIIIPDFNDLHEAHLILAAFIPREVREARVVSPGDAALGAELRLRGANLLGSPSLAGVRAVWCCAADWGTRLQSPSWVCDIDQQTLGEVRLQRYAQAVASLSSRVRCTAEGEPFWVDSAVRPLVADNLALGKPWYEHFARLMTDRDANNRPIRDRIVTESRGLHAMTTNSALLADAESALVRTVHQAIRNHLGRIRAETDGQRPLSQATLNRWDRFRQRLRLALVGAKTSDQCRTALCTLFGNAGLLTELQESWRVLLPMFSERRWQLARDLGLLALASYARPDEEPQAQTMYPS